MTSVSVLILTKNEQQDLPGCLQSVGWCDDVHVLDSGSTDGTGEIAKAAGANLALHAFEGYASQRNFGLSLPFKHGWVLILDADERVPPKTALQFQQFVTEVPAHVAAARLRRRDIWWGRWLKHAQISPFFIRLVRVGRARYEREINEVLRVDGEVVDLSEPFDHYPFSKGVDHWLAKHNAYSRMEAELIATGAGVRGSWRTALFGNDFNERRVHQKALFYRMPARPLIKFLYMMLGRRAFLDGWPGVRYAILQSIYEYMIVLKVRELEQAASASQRAP
jgi:glycosyltransferase involved in cell wall biosynthesis